MRFLEGALFVLASYTSLRRLLSFNIHVSPPSEMKNESKRPESMSAGSGLEGIRVLHGSLRQSRRKQTGKTY